MRNRKSRMLRRLFDPFTTPSIAPTVNEICKQALQNKGIAEPAADKILLAKMAGMGNGVRAFKYRGELMGFIHITAKDDTNVEIKYKPLDYDAN